MLLTIRNTGEPIPEEDLPRIFDRFYRVDKARNRNEGNYGLGLAIAREILDAHGAHVDVRSAREEGTVFTIRFRT